MQTSSFETETLRIEWKSSSFESESFSFQLQVRLLATILSRKKTPFQFVYYFISGLKIHEIDNLSKKHRLRLHDCGYERNLHSKALFLHKLILVQSSRDFYCSPLLAHSY